MRIGMVTGEYPPDEGGVGDFTRELSRALADLGHAAHVITAESDQAVARSSIPIHRVVKHWHVGCWRNVLRVAREERLDLLNVQFQTAAYDMRPAIHFIPARGRRLPTVVTFHDLRVPYLFPKAGPLRWRAIRLLAERADGVIVTNRADEAQIAQRNVGAACLARIPIGSNIESRVPDGYDRRAWRRRWGVGPDDLLLGYFGFLNQRKGGEALIETLAELVNRGRPAHLLLVGGRVGSSDPTNVAFAERVDRLIEANGVTDRVHRTGFLPPEEVSASLRAVDVCLLPYKEGASLRHGSLHACLVHGRAIVTTRPALVPPELGDGENVLLAPPGDVAALADAVARLADDPALRTRLERGAASLAETFSWDGIARRTVAFLEEVLA